jgi:hypothetical protein
MADYGNLNFPPKIFEIARNTITENLPKIDPLPQFLREKFEAIGLL